MKIINKINDIIKFGSELKEKSNFLTNNSNNNSSNSIKKQDKKNPKKDKTSQVIKKLSSPVEVLTAIKELALAANEAIKYCEEQETEREKIRARRDNDIEMIRAHRDAIMFYLEKTFDERRMIFNKQFEIVDCALSQGDVKMLSLALQKIDDLASSSPFKALTDATILRDTLSQPGAELDI